MPRFMARDSLVETMARKILSLAWRPGDTIPPVRALAQSFGVARATMDAAIQEASRLGLLHTRPRRGVRVAPDALELAKVLLETFRQRRGLVRIAMLLPQAHESADTDYHNAIVALVADRARRRGWTAEPVQLPLAQRPGFPRRLVDRGYQGAFCIVAQPDRLMPLYFMRERRFPIVVLRAYPNNPAQRYVMTAQTR